MLAQHSCSMGIEYSKSDAFKQHVRIEAKMADEQQFPQPEPVSPNDVTVPDQPAYVSPTDATVPNLPPPIVPPPFPPSQSLVRRQATLFSGRTILLIILAIALIIGGLGFAVFAAIG